MVRDDFWLAVSRFMRDLEVELVQGHNTALVDLFDPRHAAQGAHGVRPRLRSPARERASSPADQQAFLDQAVAGLAQDGKVISVRLALFAEMVKGKPWTPATLRAVGGTEGVGVTFLEETFSSPQANPRHRLHQKAAQAVLKALLPESGTDIKGQMRSEEELQRRLGICRAAPRLRGSLAHPRQRASSDHADRSRRSRRRSEAAPASRRYYQLTHDYLVPSLRDWLTSKQRRPAAVGPSSGWPNVAALWRPSPRTATCPRSRMGEYSPADRPSETGPNPNGG